MTGKKNGFRISPASCSWFLVSGDSQRPGRWRDTGPGPVVSLTCPFDEVMKPDYPSDHLQNAFYVSLGIGGTTYQEIIYMFWG